MAERQSVSDKHDPYAFLLELSHIPSSQEQLLRHAPFFTYGATPEETLLPSDDGQQRTTAVGVDARRDVLGDIRDAERESSDLGESRVKKSKLSEEGSGSGADSSGVQLKKGEEEESALPPSKGRGSEGAASESKCGSSGEKNKFFLYDVLEILLRSIDEAEDRFVLFDAAKSCGLTFPCPRWWPDNFKPQK